MKKSSAALSFIMFIMTNVSIASGYMSADEVTTLVSGKTFDGIYLPKNKPFSVYEDPNGEHNVYYPQKDKHSKGKHWFVNDNGQHCTTNKNWSEPRCAYIKNAGNGEYHKINSHGEHTHTLTNFREGNQL